MPQENRSHDDPEKLVDALIAKVGRTLVVGVPIGIGKAVHVIDAIFRRAAADETLSLTIFTGLTLEPPHGKSDLERRLIEPIAERFYANCPIPEYATAISKRSLPSNIEVHEFYLRPGAYLSNPLVQRSYASINYSQVVPALLELGVNVITQLVAARDDRPHRFSLGSNPEVTLDLLPHFQSQRESGRNVAVVGQVNRNMPYMLGDAEIESESFDFVLNSDAIQFPLFAIPNRRVMPADYATAMHVASLIPDGGTLQVGIGSLSDAVAHCLMLRHRHPKFFRMVLDALPGGSHSDRGGLPVFDQPFSEGLFAASELISDALFALFEAGLIRRPADKEDPSVLHGGFFIGSDNLYRGLRDLSDERRALINMTRISEVNTLYGDEARKRRQRRNARFVNETMMVTLLGAAVSDALANGRVVSGVGGQFDFVSMAQNLEGAHSILMCRARRMNDGKPESNVHFNYPHTTVPRHFRDIFITEYGIAATRGRSDRRVVESMLRICDADFLDELIEKAKASGKLEPSYQPAEELYRNSPAAIDEIFTREDVRLHFPPYPLGSALTPEEQRLAAALNWLKEAISRPLRNLFVLTRATWVRTEDDYEAELRRMRLFNGGGLYAALMRRWLRYALKKTA